LMRKGTPYRRHRAWSSRASSWKVSSSRCFSRSWIMVAPPFRDSSTCQARVLSPSQARSVTAYRSRSFLSHLILGPLVQRRPVHMENGVDDPVAVGGVAVGGLHIAPADLTGQAHGG